MPKTKTAAPADVIVTLAASAADTAVLERFMAHLEPQDSMAVVLGLQQHEALDEEALKQALADAGRELTPIHQDSAIEAARICLPPSNQILAVESGRFHTRMAEQSPGERDTVDSFLVS